MDAVDGVTDATHVTDTLNGLAEQVLTKLSEQELQAKTITLKVKYANFQQVTRAQSVDTTLEINAVKRWIPQLLKRTKAGEQAIRLVGLSLSGLEEVSVESETAQLALVWCVFEPSW